MFNIGPSEVLVILVVGLVGVALPVWGIVDAARRPDAAWQQAGQNKTLWIVLQAAGLALCGVAAVFAVIYFADKAAGAAGRAWAMTHPCVAPKCRPVRA